MAAGIEARVPLLDDRLVSAVVTMPSRWKVKGSRGKEILRLSQQDRLPGFILSARKSGFNVPFEYWLKTSLYDFASERLNDKRTHEKFGLDSKKIEKTLRDHKSGRGTKGFLLWKLLQLSLSVRGPQVNLGLSGN